MIPTIVGCLAASLFWAALITVLAAEVRNQHRNNQEDQ